MAYSSTLHPGPCYWGQIHDAEQIIPGMWRVSADQGGGIILSEERQRAMPLSFKLPTPGHYEEQCEWCLPFVAFSEEITTALIPCPAATIQLAHDFARRWYPDQYGSFTRQPVTRRVTHIDRSREAYHALIGQIVVVSAFASWADWVPEGKTGLIGRKLLAVNYLGQPSYAEPEFRGLVEADRYDSRNSPHGFDALGVMLT